MYYKSMFDKLINLSNQLEINDISKYNQVKNARAILQDIKVEAQKLRNVLTEEHKKVKQGKESSIDFSKKEVENNDDEKNIEFKDEGKFYSK